MRKREKSYFLVDEKKIIKTLLKRHIEKCEKY